MITHLVAFALGGAVVYLYPGVAARAAVLFRWVRGLFQK